MLYRRLMKTGRKRRTPVRSVSRLEVSTKEEPMKAIALTSLEALRKYERSKGRAAISISLPIFYVEAIDELVLKEIYDSRSAAIQDAIRDLLQSKYPEILKKRLSTTYRYV